MGDHAETMGGLGELFIEHLQMEDLEGAQRAYNEAKDLKPDIDAGMLIWSGECTGSMPDQAVQEIEAAFHGADLATADLIALCMDHLEPVGFDC